MEEILRILIVGLIASSPVGELLIAYPLGIALGLDPLTSIIVSFFFNLIPIPFLLIFFNSLFRKFPRFSKWLINRGKFYEKYLKNIGLIIFLILTPILGVYATSFFMKLINLSNKISFLIQFLSLLIYSIVIYLSGELLLRWKYFI